MTTWVSYLQCPWITANLKQIPNHVHGFLQAKGNSFIPSLSIWSGECVWIYFYFLFKYRSLVFKCKHPMAFPHTDRHPKAEGSLEYSHFTYPEDAANTPPSYCLGGSLIKCFYDFTAILHYPC